MNTSICLHETHSRRNIFRCHWRYSVNESLGLTSRNIITMQSFALNLLLEYIYNFRLMLITRCRQNVLLFCDQSLSQLKTFIVNLLKNIYLNAKSSKVVKEERTTFWSEFLHQI